MLSMFFGKNMNAVFAECDKRRIPWRGMIPSQFARKMDEITGLCHIGMMPPEEGARLWLNALRNNE